MARNVSDAMKLAIEKLNAPEDMIILDQDEDVLDTWFRFEFELLIQSFKSLTSFFDDIVLVFSLFPYLAGQRKQKISKHFFQLLYVYLHSRYITCLCILLVVGDWSRYPFFLGRQDGHDVPATHR